MSGILLVNQFCAPILFDSDATCSSVNSVFVRKLVSKPEKVHMWLYGTSPLGTIYHTDLIVKNCSVNVGGETLPVNLVQLEI